MLNILNILKGFCIELSQSSVNILLLKGFGLSKYYPVPNHRPVGNIDIFPYGAHDKVNAIIQGKGVNIENSHPKHTVFLYNGVTFENHSIYLDSYQTKAEKKVQSFLEQIENDEQTSDGYYVPSPIKNYFFLLCHMSRHFSEYESITIRHLLDWDLFIKGERQNLDPDFIHSKLKEFDLVMCNDIFTSLAQDVIGVDLSAFIFNEVNQKDKDCIMADILDSKRKVFPKCTFARIVYKMKLLMSIQWKFQYLAFSYWERIVYSILLHWEHGDKV